MTFQQPQPGFSSRREELETVIAELRKQRTEASMSLTNPNWDYEATKRFEDTIKGLDILLAAAEQNLAALDEENLPPEEPPTDEQVTNARDAANWSFGDSPGYGYDED